MYTPPPQGTDNSVLGATGCRLRSPRWARDPRVGQRSMPSLGNGVCPLLAIISAFALLRGRQRAVCATGGAYPLNVARPFCEDEALTWMGALGVWNKRIHRTMEPVLRFHTS